MTAWARNSDPWTSHIATDGSNFSKVQQRILFLFAAFGEMSDEQLVENYRENMHNDTATDQSIRSRKTELVRMGQLEKKGTTTTKHGRAAFVYGLKETDND